MDEKTARALAHDIVQQFLEPFFLVSRTAKHSPLTIAELIYIGAYFTRSLVEFGFDPRDREVYSLFDNYPPDLGRLEDLLCRRLLSGKENVQHILEAIKSIGSLKRSPGSYRRVFLRMAKEVLPPGKPGRHSRIEQADLARLADSSDELVPLCQAFLTVRKHFPQRSCQQILEFLAMDFPKQVKQLDLHQQAFEWLLQDNKFLRTAKTEKSRSRLIADVMAGCDFELSPSYAVRKAKEARRRAKLANKAQN